MAKNESTRRYIHYYLLNFSFRKEHEKNEDNGSVVLLFKELIKLNEKGSKSRLKPTGEGNGKYFTVDVDFMPVKKYIKGKLIVTRDDFPQIYHEIKNSIKDIDADEEERVMETTHFLIDYKRNPAQLTIEYNHTGARVTDFINYIKFIGRNLSITRNIELGWILKDRLTSFEKKTNRFAKVTARVHKDNIARINDMDSGIFSAFDHAEKASLAETVEITFNYDYQHVSSTNKIRDSIINLVRHLIKHPSAKENFEKLKIKAEDQDNNNKLVAIDILAEKERDEVTVQKRTKSKTIVSKSIFDAMIDKYTVKFE